MDGISTKHNVKSYIYTVHVSTSIYVYPHTQTHQTRDLHVLCVCVCGYTYIIMHTRIVYMYGITERHRGKMHICDIHLYVCDI